MPTQVLAQRKAVTSTRLYRAVWRWHFYARLFVIPFLIMLAITGAFMMIYSDVFNEMGRALAFSVLNTTASVTSQAKAALAAMPDARHATYAAPHYPRDFRPALGVVMLAAFLGLTFAVIGFLLPKRLKEAGLQNA